VASPATAQAAASSRAGRRPILALADEILLARSAAPASVSARSRVFVLSDTAWVVGDSGSSDVTCLVERSWRDSLEPHCYDAEGSRTILRMEMRRDLLRHRGLDERTIDREIADGLSEGRFQLPTRPAMTYMLSAAQVLYGDDGTRAGVWHPHLMIYYPFLTDSALGLAATPDMSIGMVSSAGRPDANLTIIMAHFVDLPSNPGRR
jgi:hypothetical protein